jgi:hypothetical protein
VGVREAVQAMAAEAPAGAATPTRAEALQGHFRTDRRLISAFVRRGVPGGLRVGLVVSGFLALEMGAGVVRQRIDWANGLAAGVLTGVLYGLAGADARAHWVSIRSFTGAVGARSPAHEGSLGRLGRTGTLQLLALSTVCGGAYGVAQDVRLKLDAPKYVLVVPRTCALWSDGGRVCVCVCACAAGRPHRRR